MFTEKKDGNRAPLAEMDKDETDVLHHQGAIGGINLSFSPRKSSETDKEEGMVKFGCSVQSRGGHGAIDPLFHQMAPCLS